MGFRTIRLLRSIALTAAGTLTFAPLAILPAGAVSSPSASVASVTLPRYVEREGHCRFGGDWQLDVERMPRGRIRIDFKVDDVRRRQRWQVFLSDNGYRVAAATRFTRLSGDFRIRKRTLNRRGRDRVAASAINPRSGNRCTGVLRF